jgi:hypothetical protein
MSKIVNLKSYDIVFITSFENTYGITGHIYEMLEYYIVCRRNNIIAGIALLDGTPLELLSTAIDKKYTFSQKEKTEILADITVCTKPSIILAKNLCVVDGAPRFGSCVIYADNVLLLRCWDGPLDYFHKHKSIKRTHLLQDFSMYTERYTDINITVVDYKKKLLWDRYIVPKTVTTGTAMFYMMNSSKARPAEEIAGYIAKYHFEHYLIVTDTPTRYQHLTSNSVQIEKAPIDNLFERFDTYIYTPVDKIDCSPRFIVECAVFGKHVIYEVEQLDAGVAARQRDLELGVDTLLLKDSDFFIEYVRSII